MANTDRFQLAGVMGWPILQSRSPMLHNYWFERHRLAGSYVPLAIPPQGLAAALRALPALTFAGCNLTIPHKQTAMAIVDEVDTTARKIGAISCVTVRADGSLAGTNNDHFGFIENVMELAPDWRANAGLATVIGAGGGGRAVVWGLMERGAREIRLVNRTAARAEAVARDLGGPITVVPWRARHEAIDGCTTLVNATSQGMIGQPPLDLALDRLPAGALVCDIIYNPLETPLLTAARMRGNRTIGGLGMLLHQGRPAWRAWFDLEPQVTTELRELVAKTL